MGTHQVQRAECDAGFGSASLMIPNLRGQRRAARLMRARERVS